MGSQTLTEMSPGMLQEMHVNINRQPNKYTNPMQQDIHIQTDSLISKRPSFSLTIREIRLMAWKKGGRSHKLVPNYRLKVAILLPRGH